jgi:hypothetical protein
LENLKLGNLNPKKVGRLVKLWKDGTKRKDEPRKDDPRTLDETGGNWWGKMGTQRMMGKNRFEESWGWECMGIGWYVSLGNLSKLENGWKWYNEGKKFFFGRKRKI